MATKAEVRQRIGEELRLVAIGQALDNQDKVRIDAGINEAYGKLKSKGISLWAQEGTYPDAIVPYFCLIVEENLIRSTYAVSNDLYQRIKLDAGQDGIVAMRNLSSALQPFEFTNTDVVDF